MEAIILMAGAAIIAFLVFTFLIRLVKTTLTTAFFVAAVMLLLMFLGIGPEQVLDVFASWLGWGAEPATQPTTAPLR